MYTNLLTSKSILKVLMGVSPSLLVKELLVARFVGVVRTCLTASSASGGFPRGLEPSACGGAASVIVVAMLWSKYGMTGGWEGKVRKLGATEEA